LAAGRIVQVDLASGATKVVATGLAAPEGLAMDAQGRLLVVETGRGRIAVIDPKTGAQPETIDVDLPVGLRSPAGPPSYLPNGVAAGRDGSIYMSSDVDSAVYRLVKR
jgi:glucose/arabinose dehydrogenase